MDTTTIQLKKSTKMKLDQLKIGPGESMDSVIDRLTSIAIDDEPLTKEDMEGIKRGLRDIEQGRMHSSKEVYKKLGI